jgi:serine protease Do
MRAFGAGILYDGPSDRPLEFSMPRACRVFALAPLLFFYSHLTHAQLPDFTGLVERNNAAVVNISTTQKSVQPDVQLQGPEGLEMPEGVPFDDLLKRYFGEGGAPQIPGMPGGPQSPNAPPSEAMSLGSGFILSSDGFIVTNHHVVKDAEEVVVRLQDRRELVAKIIGSDKRSDIALLKVDAKDLPVVKLGTAETLKVGEWVLAIGSPFGFDHSATAGIVSAKGRSLPSDNYVPFIQTDVAINPGNSGGPLFNLSGEVVGVNSQIYSQTGGFMGLSFAIPIDVAVNVVDQLKVGGKVTRGWLGVQIQDVTRELADSFGMKKPQGALVAKVLPKSPAAAAGLQPGDIIEAFNDHEIATSNALPPLVGATKIGDTATLRVVRQGKAQTISIKIGMLPDEDVLAQNGSDADAKGSVVARLNVQAMPLTEAQRSQMELPKTGGVLITSVKAGPAMDAGIRPGDVVLRVQDQLIRDLNHFEEVVKTLPKDKSIALLIHRHGGAQFLALKLKD